MTTARIGLLLLGATLGLACRSPSTMPEPGAALVRVTAPAGAAAPDELRAWVYDDGGRLWDGVRIPESGPLVITNATDLGTVLIQPGTMVVGALRVHVRAFAAGARVLDGTLSMGQAGRDQKTFVLALDAAVPIDDDGDDVPDVIDDCPGVANPLQGGCPSAPTKDAAVDAEVDASAVDAGTDAVDAEVDASAADASVDAGLDASVDVGVDASLDLTVDMGVDTPTIPDASIPDVALPDVRPPDVGGTKATGTACAAAGECATTFCVDGVCCANACLGRCQSCNQPGKLGACQAFASGQDPDRECGTGMTCNGVGGCILTLPPPLKLPGAACTAKTECLSGFCADKVCCNTACSGVCQNCAGGTCNVVQRMDDVPECAGTKTCNPKGVCVAN